MNPHDLSASDLFVWGVFLHLAADWAFQNEWMAKNKQNLLHPAGWVHAGMHLLFLTLIFGWAAFPLAFAHLLIDTRKPVEWWSKLLRQSQPAERYLTFPKRRDRLRTEYFPLWDIGNETRIWVDQVFHIACIAAAALLVA